MGNEGETRTDYRKGNKAALWINRVAFSVVFIINVMCAIQFIAQPDMYASAYELQGASGRAALQGMGVVFLMWNATYPLFIFKPDRFFALGGVIISQQVIGCIGESLILVTLAPGHELLASSIMRFIAFDAGGLVLEVVAFTILVLTRRPPRP